MRKKKNITLKLNVNKKNNNEGMHAEKRTSFIRHYFSLSWFTIL